MVYKGAIKEVDLPPAAANNFNLMIRRTDKRPAGCVLNVLNVVEVAVKKPLTSTAHSNRRVASSMHTSVRNPRRSFREELIKEIKVMKQLHYHVHLVNLIAYCTLSQSKLFVVMEYCERGCLLDFLRRNKESSIRIEEETDVDGEEETFRLTVKDLVSFSWQICNALVGGGDSV